MSRALPRSPLRNFPSRVASAADVRAPAFPSARRRHARKASGEPIRGSGAHQPARLIAFQFQALGAFAAPPAVSRWPLEPPTSGILPAATLAPFARIENGLRAAAVTKHPTQGDPEELGRFMAALPNCALPLSATPSSGGDAPGFLNKFTENP